MKGDPDFVVLKYPAWLDATTFEHKILGAIVRYPFKPTNEYLPDSPLRYNKTELLEGQFTDFLHDKSRSKSRDASSGLYSLFGLKWQGSTEETVRLQGKLLRVKRLQQHAQFWSQLKTDPAVSAQVPGWISLLNTWPPCLVVGIMTAEDVELDFSGAKERRYEGEIQVPVATVALSAAGAPSGLLGNVGNPHVTAGSGVRTATVFRASSAQRRIIALELRIVTTALLRRRELTLRENGPKVGVGRLADDDKDFAGGEDLDEVVLAEDLILENFTEEEYEEMS